MMLRIICNPYLPDIHPAAVHDDEGSDSQAELLEACRLKSAQYRLRMNIRNRRPDTKQLFQELKQAFKELCHLTTVSGG